MNDPSWQERAQVEYDSGAMTFYDAETLDERLGRIKRGAAVAEDVRWLVAQVEILSQRRLAQWFDHEPTEEEFMGDRLAQIKGWWEGVVPVDCGDIAHDMLWLIAEVERLRSQYPKYPTTESSEPMSTQTATKWEEFLDKAAECLEAGEADQAYAWVAITDAHSRAILAAKAHDGATG